MLKVKKGYTFDDLLLVPDYSNIRSRTEVNTSVDLGKNVTLGIPVVSANMKNVTGLRMADAMAGMGGLGILHRFDSTEERLQNAKSPVRMAHSVGVGGEELAIMHELVQLGASILCVDVAHGHHQNCLDMVEMIAKSYPHVLLIAGNVATARGAKALYNAGADVIKVGVGPGSLCTTRVETGNGVPQMTALSEVYAESMGEEWIEDENYPPRVTSTHTNRKFKIIADGGIRRAGDIVKALCFADAVMLGSLLAGTDESPGTVMKVDGLPVKAYEGSSTHKTSHIEGIKAYVPLKGPVTPIVQSLMEGVRSGCSYQGVNNLFDLKDSPEFVEISNAGLAESHPHSVIKRDTK